MVQDNIGNHFTHKGAWVELRLLLTADYANVAEGGKLNVMGIFQNISSSTFPARHPEMYVIANLQANPSEYDQTRKLTIKLIDEDGSTELVNFTKDVKIPRPTGRQSAQINQILRLRDVVFPKVGTYQVSLLIDNDEKGSRPIEVRKA